MVGRRLKELAAIAMIGDGMVGFAGRPALVRTLSAVEIGAGIWLALRQYPE